MRLYCHLCGSPYDEGKQQPFICSACGNKYYANPSPTVDLALFDEKGRVMIAKRGENPHKGKFDLPGGFLELHESAEEGLRREAFEELELQSEDFTAPIFVGSQPATYEYSKESRPILIFVFAAKLLMSRKITPHDDVAAIRFVNLSELPDIDFSMPNYHPQIIKAAHKLLFS